MKKYKLRGLNISENSTSKKIKFLVHKGDINVAMTTTAFVPVEETVIHLSCGYVRAFFNNFLVFFYNYAQDYQVDIVNNSGNVYVNSFEGKSLKIKSSADSKHNVSVNNCLLRSMSTYTSECNTSMKNVLVDQKITVKTAQTPVAMNACAADYIKVFAGSDMQLEEIASCGKLILSSIGGQIEGNAISSEKCSVATDCGNIKLKNTLFSTANIVSTRGNINLSILEGSGDPNIATNGTVHMEYVKKISNI